MGPPNMVKKTSKTKTEAPPAPVEVSPQEEHSDSSMENIFQNLYERIGKIKAELSQLVAEVKNVQKQVNKSVKETEKINKKKKDRPKREPSGFAKPTKISQELCDFLKKPSGTEMARTEVTKYLTSYIKEHKLQFEEDKRKINPDVKLKKLLNLKKEDEVTYFNLQKYMKPHFHS